MSTNAYEEYTGRNDFAFEPRGKLPYNQSIRVRNLCALSNGRAIPLRASKVAVTSVQIIA
jgi:hypothetical protein